MPAPVPTTGTSIGSSRGAKRTGTLGGYVSVRFRRKPGLDGTCQAPASYEIVAGMTCRHVVSSKLMRIMAHPDNDCISVPSTGDHEYFKETLLEADSQVKNSYHNHAQFSRLKTKQEAVVLSKVQEKILGLYEQNKKLEKQRGELCKAFDPRFGTGDSDMLDMDEHSRLILDWALVALDPFRVGFNKACIPGALTDLQAMKLQQLHLHKDGHQIMPHNVIADIDELQASFGAPDGLQCTVFMVGRTSGMTKGAITHVDATVYMRTKIDGLIEPILVAGKVTVIVTPRSALAGGPCRKAHTFGMKGDSGSLVYSYQGKALAVYHGGLARCDSGSSKPEPDYDRGDGIHFATPIKATFNDIIKVLASEPANAEYDIEAVELI